MRMGSGIRRYKGPYPTLMAARKETAFGPEPFPAIFGANAISHLGIETQVRLSFFDESGGSAVHLLFLTVAQEIVHPVED
jgi:hypothetical protein